MGRRYRLLVKLEEGSLAEHYKGLVEGSGGGEVLIKLFTTKACEPEYAKALADTAARTRALKNPAAIGFDEVGLVQMRIAAVRPFIDGYNLGDALRRLSTKEVVLPPALALYIVAEAAQVVATAHRSGWVHGAITPGNILLGADGKVRVVDFGALEAMNASPTLRALAGKGRSGYRAPEIRGATPGAPAADVYSLGSIAYELLTLRDVGSVRGGGLSTKRDALTPPSRLERRLNARLDPVIMRALDTAAPRRYKNAADLADALRGLFSVLGYAPGAGDSVKFVKELFPNEVAVSGATSGGVPFTEAFTLQTVDGAMPTGDVPVFEERGSFTSSSIPVVPDTVETGPVPPSFPGEASQPAAPEKSFEEWDAPPGAMPDAPRLASRPKRAAVKPTVRTERPPETAEQPRPTSSEVTRRRAETEEPQQVPDVAFDAGDIDGGHPRTTNDWHVPPEPERPKPKPPTVGFPVWILAVIVCLSVALFMYVAVGRRLGVGSKGLGGVKIPSLGAGAPDPAPVPERTPEPVPEAPVERVATGNLAISSDREATILLDGKEIGRTPLKLPVPVGTHTVSLTVGGVTREKQVVVKAGGEEKVVLNFVVKKPKPKGKGSR